MKPNHNAWLGAVSDIHPSLCVMCCHQMYGICVQMLCPTGFCEEAWLPKAPAVIWVEQCNPPWQLANPESLGHRGKRRHTVALQEKLKISVYRGQEDYRVERQL